MDDRNRQDGNADLLGFRRWVASAATAILFLFAIPAGVSAEPASDLIGRIADSSADRDQRLDAALQALGDAEVAGLLPPLLANLNSSDEAGIVLLEALARADAAPIGLFEEVAGLTETAADARLPLVYGALSSFRSREATRLLIDEAGRREGVASAAAYEGLRRQTGLDLASSAAVWDEWFATVVALSDAEWNQRLVGSLATGFDRMTGEVDTLSRELLAMNRRLYLATPQGERSPYLAELLDSSRDILLRQGLTFVSQELQLARPLEPVVGRALIALLKHGHADVRAEAARLLDRLAPDDAGQAVAEALLVEKMVGPAAALLQASERWPSPVARGAALSWLASGTTATSNAAAALFAMHRAGLLGPDDNQRILDVLRELDLATINGAGLRLLVSIGNNADRIRVSEALVHANPAIRSSAADALADRDDFVESLLIAAAHDSSLFGAATRAVTRVRRSAAGFRVIEQLPAPTPEAMRTALVAHAQQLDGEELLVVGAYLSGSLELRETLLARFMEPGGDDDESIRREGLLMLADTRLDLARPDAALAALLSLQGDDPDVAYRRTMCHVWLNQVQRAEDAGGGADAWLAGLERAIGEPFAGALAGAIEARFVDAIALSDEQQARLQDLRTRIQPPEGEEPLSVSEDGAALADEGS